MMESGDKKVILKDTHAVPAAKVPDTEPDYYMENGFMVFTAAYHLRRGYCCGNSCRHCPYGTKRKP